MPRPKTQGTLVDRVQTKVEGPTDTHPVPAGGSLGAWLQDENQQREIRRALPRTIDADRFLRMVITATKSSPDLLQATKSSMLGAVMHAAQLGLEPGPLGHVYILPFKNRNKNVTEAQFIIGYRGYIDLALRSNRIKSVIARKVYDDEEIEVEYGTNARITHKPRLDVAAGGANQHRKVIGYYAVITYPNDGYTFQYLTHADIAHHRSMSKSPNSPAWRDHYDAMALKTCIRVLTPYLPMSAEIAEKLADDDEVIDLDVNDVSEIVVTATTSGDPDGVSAPPEAITASATEDEPPVTGREAEAEMVASEPPVDDVDMEDGEPPMPG